MTPEQIALVRASFAHVAPIADTAAALFYARLFRIDPSLRRLFRGDMATQGQLLMQMLTVAVRLLDMPGQLVPALQRLGARHAGYGVEPAHYASVGRALLDTRAMALGKQFDAATREAWTALYTLASRTMIEAAAAETTPAAA